MIARNPELIELSAEIETKTAAFLASGGKIKTDLKSGLGRVGFNSSKIKKETTILFQSSIQADIEAMKSKQRERGSK